MRLLNGYYIGKSGSECKYSGYDNDTNEPYQEVCTTESLKTAKMKSLTSTAKNMIENTVWSTYATEGNDKVQAYLQEMGIISEYNGKSFCEGKDYEYCNDTVERTTNWTGLVGLMSVADISYADGWLYSPIIDGELLWPWTLTSYTDSGYADYVWHAVWDSSNFWYVSNQLGVWPSVYLKSNIQIIGGNGGTEPFKLK